MENSLLKNQNFILHWLSMGISQTGSFFSIVALPWLVLYITNNDPVVMTTVLAAGSLPHGIFILFGGVLSDRIFPYKILLYSRSVFVLVMSSLATLVYLGSIPLWLIYGYAFVLGTLGAFAIPSSQSLLPLMLDKSELGKANGIVMGTMQLAQIVGPVLAGWLIWFGRSITGIPASQVDYSSLALAFTVDALAVFIAVILLCFMSIKEKRERHGRFFKMVGQGFRFCWVDHGIRIVLVYLILISFLLHGPLMAVLPLYTKVNLGLAEGAYGSLYAMTGVGTIIGACITAFKASRFKRLGQVVLICDLIGGFSFYTMGQFQATWFAAIMLLVMGICGGIIMVAGTTWFQKRTPEAYMGRVMGILMFSIIGLIPVSATISGFLINISSVEQLMAIAGSMIILISGLGLMIPKIRNMGELPTLGVNELYALNLSS